MGLGRHKDGKFDLMVSLRHAADEARVSQWERSFRRASEILFDATDGQMQFGRIYVAAGARGSNEADMWLMQEEGTSYSNVLGLGDAGLHMTLMGDERNKPFVIIHEFGHYGLGLWDEYTGPAGTAECRGGTTDGACIMEHGYWNGDQISDTGVLTPGPVNEFCVTSNHDADGDTNQQAFNGESCWVTIHDNYPAVTAPTGLPDAPVPVGHDPVEWIRLADESRFALVLDHSGSMGSFHAIDGVRFGADYWVDFLAATDDRLAIVGYNHAQDVVLPCSIVSTISTAAVKAAIDALAPGGTTNIGGAIGAAIDQIGSPGTRAATQVMILFTDGLHNTGPSPLTYVGQLVERGIRLYTIGFGSAADQALLQNLAQQTGGRFEQIDAPETGSAQLDIQNYLIEISGEVRDGSGIITMAPGLLPEPTASERTGVARMLTLGHTPADLAVIKARPLAFRMRSAGFDRAAYVERGARRASFVLSHEAGKTLKFYLTRPDGSVVSPHDPGVRFAAPAGKPYAFYVVDHPAAGHWVMRVVRGQDSDALRFKVFAFSDNPAISVGVQGIRRRYDVGDVIRIGAQAFHHVALTRLAAPTLDVRAARAAVGDGIGAPAGLLKHLVLRPVPPVRPGLRGRPRVRVQDDGLYRGELTFRQPGSYSVELGFVNSGQAVRVRAGGERVRPGDRQDPITIVPFERVRRFQIHVGALPAGRDIDR